MPYPYSYPTLNCCFVSQRTRKIAEAMVTLCDMKFHWPQVTAGPSGTSGCKWPLEPVGTCLSENTATCCHIPPLAATCIIEANSKNLQLMIPQAVWTHLRLLMVGQKQLCLDRWGARAWTANSLLLTVDSYFSKTSTCISTAQVCKIWVAAASACRECALVVVRCGAVRIFAHGGHFSWQAWSKVDFS